MEKYDLYKYYKGEKENPFDKEKETVLSKFWHGENMFVQTKQSLTEWEKYAKTILEELKTQDKIKYETASKYSLSNFAVILYIETLFEKWCPYDNLEWIYQY